MKLSTFLLSSVALTLFAAAGPARAQEWDDGPPPPPPPPYYHRWDRPPPPRDDFYFRDRYRHHSRYDFDDRGRRRIGAAHIGIIRGGMMRTRRIDDASLVRGAFL